MRQYIATPIWLMGILFKFCQENCQFSQRCVIFLTMGRQVCMLSLWMMLLRYTGILTQTAPCFMLVYPYIQPIEPMNTVSKAPGLMTSLLSPLNDLKPDCWR